mgnify:CR=1 FL=1
MLKYKGAGDVEVNLKVYSTWDVTLDSFFALNGGYVTLADNRSE